MRTGCAQAQPDVSKMAKYVSFLKYSLDVNLKKVSVQLFSLVNRNNLVYDWVLMNVYLLKNVK